MRRGAGVVVVSVVLLSLLGLAAPAVAAEDPPDVELTIGEVYRSGFTWPVGFPVGTAFVFEHDPDAVFMEAVSHSANLDCVRDPGALVCTVVTYGGVRYSLETTAIAVGTTEVVARYFEGGTDIEIEFSPTVFEVAAGDSLVTTWLSEDECRWLDSFAGGLGRSVDQLVVATLALTESAFPGYTISPPAVPNEECRIDIDVPEADAATVYSVAVRSGVHPRDVTGFAGRFAVAVLRALVLGS